MRSYWLFLFFYLVPLHTNLFSMEKNYSDQASVAWQCALCKYVNQVDLSNCARCQVAKTKTTVINLSDSVSSSGSCNSKQKLNPTQQSLIDEGFSCDEESCDCSECIDSDQDQDEDDADVRLSVSDGDGVKKIAECLCSNCDVHNSSGTQTQCAIQAKLTAGWHAAYKIGKPIYMLRAASHNN